MSLSGNFVPAVRSFFSSLLPNTGERKREIQTALEQGRLGPQDPQVCQAHQHRRAVQAQLQKPYSYEVADGLVVSLPTSLPRLQECLQHVLSAAALGASAVLPSWGGVAYNAGRAVRELVLPHIKNENVKEKLDLLVRASGILVVAYFIISRPGLAAAELFEAQAEAAGPKGQTEPFQFQEGNYTRIEDPRIVAIQARYVARLPNGQLHQEIRAASGCIVGREDIIAVTARSVVEGIPMPSGLNLTLTDVQVFPLVPEELCMDLFRYKQVHPDNLYTARAIYRNPAWRGHSPSIEDAVISDAITESGSQIQEEGEIALGMLMELGTEDFSFLRLDRSIPVLTEPYRLSIAEASFARKIKTDPPRSSLDPVFIEERSYPFSTSMTGGRCIQFSCKSSDYRLLRNGKIFLGGCQSDFKSAADSMGSPLLNQEGILVGLKGGATADPGSTYTAVSVGVAVTESSAKMLEVVMGDAPKAPYAPSGREEL